MSKQNKQPKTNQGPAEQKEQDNQKRYAHIQNEWRKVKFSQLTVNTELYRHRSEEQLGKVDELMVSIVQEGQQEPTTVIEAGTDANGTKLYTVIAGHRRYEATKNAIEGNKPGFSTDMLVDVQVLVPGDNQSKQSFHRDVLVRSVSTNEYREKIDDLEKIKIVAKFEENHVDVDRGMAALGVSRSTYDRYRQIASTSWLSKAVTSGDLKPTVAVGLLEEIKKLEEDRPNPNVNCMGLLKDLYFAFVREAGEKLKADNDRQLKKNKDPLTGKKAHLSRYYDAGTKRLWLASLKAGEVLMAATFRYGLDVKTADGGAIEIPSLKLKGEEISVEKLEEVIRGLADGLDSLAKLLVQVRRRQPVNDEESQEALKKLLADRKGRDVPDETPQPPQQRELAAEIEADLIADEGE